MDKYYYEYRDDGDMYRRYCYRKYFLPCIVH